MALYWSLDLVERLQHLDISISGIKHYMARWNKQSVAPALRLSPDLVPALSLAIQSVWCSEPMLKAEKCTCRSRPCCWSTLVRPLRRWLRRLWRAWWLCIQALRLSQTWLKLLSKETLTLLNTSCSSHRSPMLKCHPTQMNKIKLALAYICVVTKTDIELIVGHCLFKWTNALLSQIAKLLLFTFE